MKSKYVAAILALVIFSTIPAFAAVTVDIRSPTPDQLADENVSIVVTVSSTYEITSVLADIEGRTAQLTFSTCAFHELYCSPGWIGTINLSGLAEGQKTLTVTATDYYGDTGTQTRIFNYDTPPTVTVTEPLNESVATPVIRITASCSDTGGNCTSLKVEENYFNDKTLLVTGTNSIDQDISLEAYNGRKITLDITGTDSRGQETTITRIIYVEPSARLHKVIDVPGAVWDYGDDGRILFLDTVTGGNVLKIIDTLQGTTTTVFDQSGKTPEYGFLTPLGAIFVEYGDISRLSSLIHDWTNGSLIDLGHPNSYDSLVAKGNYAIWCQQPNLILRDLSTGTNTTISTNAGNWHNDVASNGDVVYWDLSYQINRYRNGLISQLTHDGDLWNTYPLTDGTNIVYRKSTPCCINRTHTIAMYGTSGESILSPAQSQEPIPGQDYQLNNGWIAYTQPGTSGQLQVWLRSPNGTTEQVTFFGDSSRIVALSPDGELFFSRGGKLYFFNSAKETIEISTALPKPVYVNDAWHAIIGRSIFTISTENGTAAINPAPVEMDSMAPWTLTGPDSYSLTGAGDLTVSYLAAGDYTITWGDVSGWIKPSPAMETKALTSGGTIIFSGTYVEQAPIIQVTQSSLYFGYVPPGSYKDLILEAKNVGGGTLTGTVSATAPFSIVSGGNYSLGANQSQQIVVRYTAPLQEGSQTGSLTFTGGGGITIQVKGTNKKAGLPWLLLLLGN